MDTHGLMSAQKDTQKGHIHFLKTHGIIDPGSLILDLDFWVALPHTHTHTQVLAMARSRFCIELDSDFALLALGLPYPSPLAACDG